MKNYILLLMVFLLSCAGSCNKNPFTRNGIALRIENKSDEEMRFFLSKIYPDTSILSVIPGGIRMLPAREYGWYEFRSSSFFSDYMNSLPKDTLSIFVFSHDTLLKYGWDDLRLNYRIKRRYDLSLDDMERLKYIIPYP